MAFHRKVYENIDEIVDIVINDSEESDDQMGIEEEDDESDSEYEKEPALTFVGDKTPELEAEVENDRHNGDVDEPDDIIIVALNNDKNTDNVFEQPELNFEVDKISEIDLDPIDESTVDEPADDAPADDEPTDSATAGGKDSDITVTIDTPMSYNLESRLELSSSSSEEEVLLTNFAKRARVSTSRVRATSSQGSRIRVRDGHVQGIQNRVAQGGGVRVRGGGRGKGISRGRAGGRRAQLPQQNAVGGRPQTVTWKAIDEDKFVNLKQFPFTEIVGLKVKVDGNTPLDFVSLYLTNKYWNLLVIETNRFAIQFFLKKSSKYANLSLEASYR